MIGLLDRVMETQHCKICFIPMDFVRDYELMASIQSQLKDPLRALNMKGVTLASDIQYIASKCDLVLSSRLHLLILSSNVFTPVIGLSCGKKIDHFIKQFGRHSLKHLGDADVGKIYEEILFSLRNLRTMRQKSQEVHQASLKRLQTGRELLRHILNREGLGV